MSTVRLYLVRHGETAWNAHNLWQGTMDVPLSPRGRRQADALREALAPVPFDAAYTSPLRRARETADRVLAGRALAPTVVPALRELCYGLRQGWGVAARARSGLDRAWRDRPWEVRFPGGESLEEVSRRAVPAVRAIAAAHPGGCVLVSAHGHVNRVLEMHFGGIDRARFWDDAQPNATVRVLDIHPPDADPPGAARAGADAKRAIGMASTSIHIHRG
ncbi:histidine phosphatase family protein [Longimicrobium sp.]|uniref:histidine phosphatase family protein n=1 Tax=Longimicrobium sp. TaxID=2029185 RepID=UPI002E3571E2|nr:histidine phosphatase family protein [Longimicrobium sp.]HEX6037561.1 histidine phosphatase family protein [Longimicrobium sp.]